MEADKAVGAAAPVARARRRPGAWHRSRRLGALLPLLCLLLTACASTSSTVITGPPNPTATPIGQLPNPNPGNSGQGQPTNTPPPDLTGHPLPAFSDLRVAYIGTDGRLHAVSLNGAANVAGQGLPLEDINGAGVWVAGASPDRKHLAYFNTPYLTIVDVTSGILRTYNLHIGDSALSWSSDQRYLALSDANAVYCVQTSDGVGFSAPDQSAASSPIYGPFGWLDATHVAVIYLPGSSSTQTTFQSLDVTTGALRPITTIPVRRDVTSFAVEPGGQYTLFADHQYQNAPFTPIVELINNATGQITQLPHLTSMLPAFGGFTQILWRPGYEQAIIATGFPQNGDLKYYLANLANDTATPLNLSGFPEAWSPDGGTLIVATGGQGSDANGLGAQDVGEVSSGPYTLSAISMNAQGGVSAPVILTTQAMDVPVLGFVRTA